MIKNIDKKLLFLKLMMLLAAMFFLAVVSTNNVMASTKATPAKQNDTSYETGSNSKKHQIQSNAQLPYKIKAPKITNKYQGVYYNYYGYKKTHKDRTKIINGKLSAKQQKELADYAITLINSYRAKKKLKKLVFGSHIQQATVDLARVRNRENKGFNHVTFNHHELKPFAKRNLYFSAENLGVIKTKKITILQAKVEILNMVTAMIYQDGASQDGHRKTFESVRGMGVALQATPKTNNKYTVIFEGVGRKNRKIANNKKVADKKFNNYKLVSSRLLK